MTKVWISLSRGELRRYRFRSIGNTQGLMHQEKGGSETDAKGNGVCVSRSPACPALCPTSTICHVAQPDHLPVRYPANLGVPLTRLVGEKGDRTLLISALGTSPAHSTACGVVRVNTTSGNPDWQVKDGNRSKTLEIRTFCWSESDHKADRFAYASTATACSAAIESEITDPLAPASHSPFSISVHILAKTMHPIARHAATSPRNQWERHGDVLWRKIFAESMGRRQRFAPTAIRANCLEHLASKV